MLEVPGPLQVPPAIATAERRREILARWRPLGLMGLLGVGVEPRLGALMRAATIH